MSLTTRNAQPALALLIAGAVMVLGGCVSRPQLGAPQVLEPGSEEEFTALLEESDAPVLAAFTSDNCPSCENMGSTLELLASEYGQGLLVVKADLGLTGGLIGQYNLMKVPTFIIFRDTIEIKRRQGWAPAAFMRSFIDSALSTPKRSRQ